MAAARRFGVRIGRGKAQCRRNRETINFALAGDMSILVSTRHGPLIAC
jgi:hypothetical protein